MRSLIGIALALLPLLSSAQSTVNQGNGSPAVVEWRMNASANRAGKSQQVLVLNSAAVAVPATTLTSRKAIEIQNLGPNAIYCTVDGQTPVVASLGRQVAAGASWALDAGPSITIKCIAATADQVSGAATQVTEVR